jgi:hypothetical protein
MKRYLKWILLFSILILILINLPAHTYAQGDPGNPGCDPDDPYCPIDGGLTALLAVGAAYGIKKVKDLRKS